MISSAISKISKAIEEHSSAFIITDSTVEPLIDNIIPSLNKLVTRRLIIPAGEEHKSLRTAAELWSALASVNADRNALILNIGGGAVSDLGGFVASTFKRGIDYINIPTTILAAVDASIGGKTAIDLQGIKNCVGSFALPLQTILIPEFFSSLPAEQIYSGFGEIVKTALIDQENSIPTSFLLQAIDNLPSLPASHSLLSLIQKCAAVKQRIVQQDLHDQGLRKTLNLGHTAAHALETIALRRGSYIPHGIAVIHGIAFALTLGSILKITPSELLYNYRQAISSRFPRLNLHCKDMSEIIKIMHADKKNTSDRVSFVLLKDIGKPLIISIEDSHIMEALDIFHEIMI